MILVKYFIYCRKSSESEDKQILSNPAQERELTDLATKLNLSVVDIYKEEQTAHKTGRPKFEEMLSRIEKGEANGIIVWDESRIARNSLDGGKVIYMIDLGQIVEIRKPNKLYQNTPDDKSWLAMCFMMSKKESDDKGVNVKRGLRQKAEQGWNPSSWGKPGYTWDKFAERGNKTILEDPIRYPVIKKAWDALLSGIYTVPQVLDKLNNEWGYRGPKHKSLGGKPMARSQLYLTFKDPFYYGSFTYKDKDGVDVWYKGKHKPMITKEEFDRAQILLGRRGLPRPKAHNFEFTGLMSCGECGAMVTCEEKWQTICPACKHKFASLNKTACPKCNISIEEMVNPKIRHYVYYHCTKRKNEDCSQLSITFEEFEKQVDALLDKIQISESFRGWAIKYLNELNDQEVVDRGAVFESLNQAYQDCVRRIDNLIKLKISPQNLDGTLLSDEEFKSQKEALLKEKADLQEKLNDADGRVSKWLELSEKTFDFACHARYWFQNGDRDKRREIMFNLGSNLVLYNKTVAVNLQKPFEWTEKAKEKVPEISPMFEPNKKGLTKAQMDLLFAKNPTLLLG